MKKKVLISALSIVAASNESVFPPAAIKQS